MANTGFFRNRQMYFARIEKIVIFRRYMRRIVLVNDQGLLFVYDGKL